MSIKPSIRSNIFLNAHPYGCQTFVNQQIEEVKKLGYFKGPKKVLIIGGSSGYGLASRIALAYGAQADTINVSFETPPKAKRTGTAGWWNNIYFQEAVKETKKTHKDFIGDAFSPQLKDEVIQYIKTTFGKIDLIIYSLAAGGRMNYDTNTLIRSHIKAVGEEASGKTIDLSDMKVKPLTVSTGTQEEIDETVFVMGGSDWADWVHRLDDAFILDQGIKTIAYTYIGGPVTEKIYRKGTLGYAKKDLENHADDLNKYLSHAYNGEALISSSKAVTTKASVFIPQMTVYVSCLYEVMHKHGVHESILEHKFRLFKDMVYGEKRIVDEHDRIRLDHKEMDEMIQKETCDLMLNLSDEHLMRLWGTQKFISEFFQMNGFGYDDVDYEADVDLDVLSLLKP